MRVVFLQQHNGFPTSGLEPRINPVRFRAHLIQKMFVAVYFRAARRSNLHKREAMLVSGMKIQEVLDAPEALNDSLRVIDAIDAHAEQAPVDPQLAAQRRALFSRIPRFVSAVA